MQATIFEAARSLSLKQKYQVVQISDTHGVDFTNFLCAAFMRADPKSAKNTVKQSVFFALLGSVLVKCW